RSTTFFRRTLIGATAGMRVSGIRWTIHDVHASTIGLPPRNAGCEVLIRVSDSPVVLFLVLVFRGVGGGIATEPELFDELVFFLVVGELLEGRSFFVGDDPADVLIHPLVIDFLLLLQGFSLRLFLFLAELASPGIVIRILWGLIAFRFA